jgi:hypothetical protein
LSADTGIELTHIGEPSFLFGKPIHLRSVRGRGKTGGKNMVGALIGLLIIIAIVLVLLKVAVAGGILGLIAIILLILLLLGRL